MPYNYNEIKAIQNKYTPLAEKLFTQSRLDPKKSHCYSDLEKNFVTLLDEIPKQRTLNNYFRACETNKQDPDIASAERFFSEKLSECKVKLQTIREDALKNLQKNFDCYDRLYQRLIARVNNDEFKDLLNRLLFRIKQDFQAYILSECYEDAAYFLSNLTSAYLKTEKFLKDYYLLKTEFNNFQRPQHDLSHRERRSQVSCGPEPEQPTVLPEKVLTDFFNTLNDGSASRPGIAAFVATRNERITQDKKVADARKALLKRRSELRRL